MTNVSGQSKQELHVSAVVTRCGCPKGADLYKTHGTDAQGNLLPCPNPRLVQDLDRVSGLYADPWVRARMRVRSYLMVKRAILENWLSKHRR